MEWINMAETTSNVQYRREGHIAHIVLSRPNRLNAFNDALVNDLAHALNQLDDDDDAWVGIISGDGRAFSSGADVRERQLRSRDEMDRLGGPEGRGSEGHSLLYSSVRWKPVIAAVHGYALGMALGLVLQCDLAIATDETQMQVTETPRGLWPNLYWRRLQFRGAGRFADEVVFTGRFFTGREAADAGVITKSVPEGNHLDAAVDLAEQVNANPPLAVRAAVRTRRYYMQQSEFEQPILRGGMPALHLTEDFKESAQAFVEKRKPSPYQAR